MKKIEIDPKTIKDKGTVLSSKKYWSHIKKINDALFIVECPECYDYVASYSEREFFNGMLYTTCTSCNIKIDLTLTSY